MSFSVFWDCSSGEKRMNLPSCCREIHSVHGVCLSRGVLGASFLLVLLCILSCASPMRGPHNDEEGPSRAVPEPKKAKKSRPLWTTIVRDKDSGSLTMGSTTPEQRTKARSEFRHDRYEINLIKAQNSEILRKNVEAVRYYSKALQFAVKDEEREHCERKIRDLSEYVLATTKPATRRHEEPLLTLTNQQASKLAPIPDYRSYSEADLLMLIRHTGEASRKAMILGKHSSFLGQARAAYGDSSCADAIAERRYQKYLDNERVLVGLNKVVMSYEKSKNDPRHRQLLAVVDRQNWTYRERLAIVDQHLRYRSEFLRQAKLVRSVRRLVRSRAGGVFGGLGFRIVEPNQLQKTWLVDCFSQSIVAKLGVKSASSVKAFEKNFKRLAHERIRLASQLVDLALRRRYGLRPEQIAFQLNKL